MTFQSPAKELQSHLDIAVNLDWLTGDVQEIQPTKLVLTGMVLMSTIAIVGWVGIFQIAFALI